MFTPGAPAPGAALDLKVLAVSSVVKPVGGTIATLGGAATWTVTEANAVWPSLLCAVAFRVCAPGLRSLGAIVTWYGGTESMVRASESIWRSTKSIAWPAAGDAFARKL